MGRLRVRHQLLKKQKAAGLKRPASGVKKKAAENRYADARENLPLWWTSHDSPRRPFRRGGAAGAAGSRGEEEEAPFHPVGMTRGAVASVNNCARRGEGVGARSLAQVASGDTEWDLRDKEDETEAGWGRGHGRASPCDYRIARFSLTQEG